MKTTTTIIAIFAIIDVMGIGSVAAGLIQTVHADKNCSVGKAIQGIRSDGTSGQEWGQVVSDHAQQGCNGETFSGFNANCHS